MRNLYRAMTFVVSCMALSQCAGSRPAIKLNELAVPVSLSAYVFGSDGQVLAKGRGLTVLGSFRYQKRFWGILWSFVALSDDRDVSAAINSQVRAAGGQALVNLRVQAEYCLLNGIPFLGMLPFWPGCTLAQFSADIVKAQ